LIKIMGECESIILGKRGPFGLGNPDAEVGQFNFFGNCKGSDVRRRRESRHRNPFANEEGIKEGGL